MFRFAAALLLAGAIGLLGATPAQAQIDPPVPALFVASDGPVTVTSLTSISRTEVWYSTGPGLTDRVFAGQVMSGGSLTTSALSSGTNVMLATPILNYFVGCNGCGSVQLITGMQNPQNALYTAPDQLGNPYEMSRQRAAVFFQPNNTALVGVPNRSDMPITGPLSSFPIQFSVSNVRGTIGMVPEPEMWLLTLAGLVGAGLLRRRRR
jgi:hypothetical protein